MYVDKNNDVVFIYDMMRIGSIQLLRLNDDDSIMIREFASTFVFVFIIKSSMEKSRKVLRENTLGSIWFFHVYIVFFIFIFYFE